MPNKNSIVQVQAKCIIKKNKNLKKKAPIPKKYLKKIRKNDMEDDVIFIKQVFVHPRDRLARATNEKGEVIFVRQVPTHPRDWLKKKQKH